MNTIAAQARLGAQSNLVCEELPSDRRIAKLCQKLQLLA
jgi:hypothetical protein